MRTICGHDRETLRWALECEYDNLPSCGCESHKCQAQLDADDPAKLAAIIAELLRERGILVQRHAVVFTNSIAIVVRIGGDLKLPRFTMPQARKLALALLNAPNATLQDIERMIGEL